MAQLKRTLGLVEVIFFGVGSILGAGIYAIVGKVAGYGGNMIWLSFAIAAITALMTAFSYAELSSMFPKAGGEYEYVKHASNPKLGMIIGLVISLNGILSGATVSLGFAGYLSALLDVKLILGSFVVILFVWLINTLGIRQSSIVNIIFTIIEFSGLVIVVVVAVPYFGKVDYTEMPEGGANQLLLAAALSFFAYIGFEEIVKLSEETKDPQKTIPKALFVASGIVMVIYMLIAISVVSVVPWKELGESQHPLSDVMGKGMGQTGVLLISLIALFSTTNTILSNMIGSSRLLFSMGKQYSFMKFLHYAMPKRKTPIFALILVAVGMLLMASIGKLETAALIANFSIFTTFLAINISVIVLRIKEPRVKRLFQIPFSIKNIPVIPVIGIGATLLMMGYTIYGLMKGEV